MVLVCHCEEPVGRQNKLLEIEDCFGQDQEHPLNSKIIFIFSSFGILPDAGEVFANPFHHHRFIIVSVA